MTVSVIPSLPLLSLSDDENALITRLNNRRSTLLPTLDLKDAYYNGNQIIRDLGIAIPPQLRGLSTVVGWPQVAVNALDERLDVEGFRYAGALSGDDELNGIWQANNLDEESQLAHIDALVYGCAYASVGVNDDDSPLITVESARDMSVLWDVRWRRIVAALRVYGGDEYGRDVQGTLYLPNQTISLSNGGQNGGGWLVDDRDEHNMDDCLVARIPNRQRIHDRDGSSEITPQVMSTTDSACRTLLGLEAAREFYVGPRMAILGANESAFQNADGTAKSVWETYIGRILALENDENGQRPDIKMLASMDPTPFTKIMDLYRQEMATLTGLTPYMLGETTQNPASADAIRSAENPLIRRAERRQTAFSGGWETVMRLALRVLNNGVLPKGAERIETDWASAATPTPAATTDALQKQVAAGIVSPRSDVVRKRAGYSVAERKRLLEDDKIDLTDEHVNQIASSMLARGMRVVKAVQADAGIDPTTTT